MGRADMTTGIITSIKLIEGYGFINDAANETYFFHKSALDRTTLSFEQLRPGDFVEFSEMNHARGRRAVQIRVIDRVPSRSGLQSNAGR
jgi:cold shock CspA family protein